MVRGVLRNSLICTFLGRPCRDSRCMRRTRLRSRTPFSWQSTAAKLLGDAAGYVCSSCRAIAGDAAAEARRRPTVTVIKLAWCCPAGQRRRRGPDVPGRRRLRTGVQPGLRRGRQRLGPARRGRGARRSRRWSTPRATPSRGCTSQRRFEVPSDQIANTMKLAIVSIEDKRFAEHNGVDWQGTLTGLSGLRVRRPRHPRRLHHRAAVREELPAAGDRADRRGEARRHRDHPGPQAARDPDGADAGQDVHQAGDPDPLSQPGVVRQRRLRHPGRRADLLRHQRLRTELAAGRAAGRHGAVDQHAEPLHQPRRRAGSVETWCWTP